MQFPRRIGLLLAKIALERVMSPERADELVTGMKEAGREINEWWNGPGVRAAEEVTVEAITSEAAMARTESVPQDLQHEAAGVIRRIEDRICELAEKQKVTESLLGQIIESEIQGKANTWVIWLDHAQVVGANGGRYIHFSYSWDATRNRFGYRIRDFETSKMFHPPQTSENRAGWTATKLTWTADDVWRAAKHRIPTNKATGLGEGDLGSVDGNRDKWRAVLNALTKNVPVTSHGEDR